jgi:deoxyribose-phosphate aldolase
MSQLNLDNDALTQIISYIDLTTLSADDTNESVRALCAKAITPYGAVACVCVYPQFVPIVKEALAAAQSKKLELHGGNASDEGEAFETDYNTSVKIAAVSNFPTGNNDILSTTQDIKQAIALGANEIDVVMPWQRFLAGDAEFVAQFLQQCKAACGNNAQLKVILETGALNTSDLIRSASILAINAGANFIKTSTGKISIGATLNAAESMLLAIRDTNREVGFKASGGVRTINDASAYIQLASEIMGTEWLSAKHFRLGASNLLDTVINELNSR